MKIEPRYDKPRCEVGVRGDPPGWFTFDTRELAEEFVAVMERDYTDLTGAALIKKAIAVANAVRGGAWKDGMPLPPPPDPGADERLRAKNAAFQAKLAVRRPPS